MSNTKKEKKMKREGVTGSFLGQVEQNLENDDIQLLSGSAIKPSVDGIKGLEGKPIKKITIIAEAGSVVYADIEVYVEKEDHEIAEDPCTKVFRYPVSDLDIKIISNELIDGESELNT